jgi:hypothetical protein
MATRLPFVQAFTERAATRDRSDAMSARSCKIISVFINDREVVEEIVVRRVHQ